MTSARRRIGGLVALLFCLLVPGRSLAEEPAASDHCPLLSPQEIAFRFAFGRGDKKSLDFYTFGPRVAYDLPSFVPQIAGNPLRIAIETTGSLIHGHGHDLDGEWAFSPLIFDYRYDTGGPLVPFLDGGEGIVLTTLDRLDIGGPFEFSSQAGGGLYYFFSPETAVAFDFRIRHISNAGIKDQNSGLNTYFFTVSLSRFPGRR
jgi:lipid A 3-O-deacylase PagL